MQKYRARQQRERKTQIMWDAVKKGSGFTDLVPWVKEIAGWTDEQKETKARRVIYCQLIRKMILDARKDFQQNQLVTEKYMRTIQEWKVLFSSYPERRCNNYDENHTHHWECGPCFECLGTGRTLLLFTSRSRGVRCIACNGSGIRSQEFEQSDFMIGDDLEGHLSELDEYQTQPALDFYSASLRSLPEDDKEIALNEIVFTQDHLMELSAEIRAEEAKYESEQLSSYQIDPELLEIARQIDAENSY